MCPTHFVEELKNEWKSWKIRTFWLWSIYLIVPSSGPNLYSCYIVRPWNFNFCLDIFSLIGPQKFICEFLFLLAMLPIQWERTPNQLDILSVKSSYTPLGPNLMGFTSWPLEIIQINQSHPPAGTKGYSNLLLLHILPPTVPTALFYPEVQPSWGPIWHVLAPFPRLWVYTTNKVLSVLSAQYWLLFGQRIPLSPMVCIWGNQENPPRSTKALHLTGPCLFGMH